MNYSSEEIIEDLVHANQILAAKGIFDSFGHVSARIGPDRFLLSRNLAPGQVTRDDLVEYDLDSEAVAGEAPRPYLERFIHGEIYRSRPDVWAIVHHHAPAMIPFGAVKTAPLKPVCHMSGFIGECAPVFEIRNAGGDDTDLLITSRDLGQALAKDLGEANLVLMRGHGTTVVGPDVRTVVYRAIYGEVNARLQLACSTLGEPTYLTAAEARAAQVSCEGQVHRPWQNWCAET
ncbi:aldolase [Sphingobium lactosutens]|uniref:class II aldolase/adducin family protein n=1 Tax=Sphingobium lactosutens TaxID=522773 RepID=UPI0015BCED44|nr:class II aldolase/adducin family protein [Sphingobium lactosutens]NWK96215.1 aldolase [Sphingobium lactosutens]